MPGGVITVVDTVIYTNTPANPNVRIRVACKRTRLAGGRRVCVGQIRRGDQRRTIVLRGRGSVLLRLNPAQRRRLRRACQTNLQVRVISFQRGRRARVRTFPIQVLCARLRRSLPCPPTAARERPPSPVARRSC